MRANTPKQNTVTFWETYVNEISPWLQEIDLLVKTSEESISVSDTAFVLAIPPDEVRQIMRSENIESISRSTFFSIMEKGSSEICKLYARELQCGSPHFYSPEQIATIYGFDPQQMQGICSELHIKEITPYTLPDVFSRLPGKLHMYMEGYSPSI